MSPDRSGLNGRVARWMMLGEWRAHPGRVIVAALAVAIGVALGFGVHLVNRSALDEFTRAVRTVDGEADLQVHATSQPGFDEGLYPLLAHVEGVEAASPVVELTAAVGSGPQMTTMSLLGLDVTRAALATPSLVGRSAIVDASDAGAFDQDALYFSAAALRASGLHMGDRVAVHTTGHVAQFTLVGILPGVAEGERLGVIDIASAQWRFGRLGLLQRVDLRLAADADRAKVGRAVQAILPQDAQIVTRASEGRRGDSLSRAYRVNLEMLAMVALLTGGFLVYSAQTLSVARRRAQFALLRVLGLNRRALLAQIALEGAIIGLIGALIGIAGGAALANLALSLLGGDLGSGYFRGSRPALNFDAPAAVVFFTLGVAAALAGSLAPALEAADARPAVALKAAGDVLDPRRAPRIWPALLLLTCAGAAAFGPPVGGLPVLGYLAIALALAGGVAATPWLARLLLAPLQRPGPTNPALHLAVRRLWGAPEQASIALYGIVASISLMVAMAVMVASFRGSVEDWLTRILPSDLYLRMDGDLAGGLDAQERNRIVALPGVASAGFLKSEPVQLAADRPPIMLIARPINAAEPEQTLPMIGRPSPAPPGRTPAWVSEPMVWLYGLHPGDALDLPLPRGGRRLYVAGVWRDYARQQGAVVLRDVDYRRLTGDELATEAAIDLVPGASSAAVIAEVRMALGPDKAAQANIARPREIRALALSLFDRSFAVTYALEVVAIVVGLTGVTATFSAQTLARTKEFGMLRHVGVRTGEIVLMLAIEGALLGAVGVVAGLGLGVGMGEVLIHVVNPQSFHWTMGTRLPLGLFAGLSAALVAASAGAAVIAGRRALSADAVRAVREDW